MQTYRPILKQHRLQRLVLWALAMLQWLAAVLFSDRPVSFRHIQRIEDTTLSGLQRLVTGLVMARALNLLARPRRSGRIHYWRRGRNMRPRHWVRSLLGSKLRRALRHKDIATHIAQLIAVLRNLDKHAAHLAQRMRCKLRRLWRTTPPIAPATALCGTPPPLPAIANSS